MTRKDTTRTTSGGVLMGLEIVGSRNLAPTFGNSIFVWGSLISVVLAALSFGYWLGGKAADRWPRGTVLALFIAVPGVMVGLMPLYYRELNWWTASQTLNSFCCGGARRASNTCGSARRSLLASHATLCNPTQD